MRAAQRGRHAPAGAVAPSLRQLCGATARVTLDYFDSRDFWKRLLPARQTARVDPIKALRVDIFWSRVEATAMKHASSRLSFGRMLGITIAHEIGHLLLPAGHGSVGLMKESWDVRDFVLASRGLLLFHEREAGRIHARLR